MLANIGNWQERIEEIEQHAPIDNGNGNKHRALTLLRDMTQASLSLRRLSGIEDD